MYSYQVERDMIVSRNTDNVVTTYIGADLEMTGTDKSKHGLLQIGAWATAEHEDHFKGYFVTDVNPYLVGQRKARREVEIHWPSMKIHGFQQKRIETAPPMYQALQAFTHYLRRYKGHQLIFVGMSILSDLAWLREEFRRNGLDGKIFSSFIELKDLTPLVFGKRMGLERTARELGIRNGDAHDALGDAYTSNKVFHRLRNILNEQGLWDQTQFLRKIGEEGSLV
jgi:DNA polymerase III epsilon subunit-like protein